MLDQMSGGRFEFGVGKGISPIETATMASTTRTGKMFIEAFAILKQGLAKRLGFEGAFYRSRMCRWNSQPLQKPYPPLWYGVVPPENAERTAKPDQRHHQYVRHRNGAGATADQYWDALLSRRPGYHRRGIAALRHEPLHCRRRDRRGGADISRAAPIVRWHDRASCIFCGPPSASMPVGVNYPEEFDGQAADGRAVSEASPSKPCAICCSFQLDETGANYLGCRFAFGDLSLEELLRSMELFLRARHAGAARKRARSRRNNAAARM